MGDQLHLFSASPFGTNGLVAAANGLEITSQRHRNIASVDFLASCINKGMKPDFVHNPFVCDSCEIKRDQLTTPYRDISTLDHHFKRCKLCMKIMKLLEILAD